MKIKVGSILQFDQAKLPNTKEKNCSSTLVKKELDVAAAELILWNRWTRFRLNSAAIIAAPKIDLAL